VLLRRKAVGLGGSIESLCIYLWEQGHWGRRWQSAGGGWGHGPGSVVSQKANKIKRERGDFQSQERADIPRSERG